MAMATRLKEYLERLDLDYTLVVHPHSDNSLMSAQQAHVHGAQLAKSVILEDDDGYLMAVVPASHHLHLGELHHMIHRRMGLATERELAPLFRDCELGAVPPVGEAYGLPVIVDDAIAEQEDIYFEAGDHTALVHMRGADFRSLLSHARHGHFSHPMS